MLSSVKENRQFGFRTFPFSAPSAPANPHGIGLSASLCRCDPPLGTEELAHLEMVSALVCQLTKGLTASEIKAQGLDAYFVDHTIGVWPQAASGAPFTSAFFQSKGDAITDLHEDMAAEQKARTTYDNIIRLVDDPDVLQVIRFLRQREIVHYQRFGEALELIKSGLDSKNFYAINPEFDPTPKS